MAHVTFQGTDRFDVLGTLGMGGMGVVYRALDRASGREVALKTTHKPGPRALYTLKREFRSRAEVRHPNLVSLHDLVIEGEHCFFTMELVEGGRTC